MVKYEDAIKKQWGFDWYVDDLIDGTKAYIWSRGDTRYMEQYELRRKVGLIIAINRWDAEVSTEKMTDKIMNLINSDSSAALGDKISKKDINKLNCPKCCNSDRIQVKTSGGWNHELNCPNCGKFWIIHVEEPKPLELHFKNCQCGKHKNVKKMSGL